MNALVETSGRQYWVKEGDRIRVFRMEAEVGAEVVLGRVLLLRGEQTVIGTPAVEGAAVRARVLSHDLGEKVMTFKYIHRRRNRRRRGFRASLTTLEIVGITG